MNLLEISDFGTIDAENDKRLLDYFVQSESLKRIKDYEKSIIIGRKGAGKTAIYKWLEENSNALISSLLFRDYPWRIHDKYKNPIVTKKESYTNSWLFLIYIELLKLIVSDKKSYEFRKRWQIRKLKKWLKRNWGSSSFNHKETMNPNTTKFGFEFKPTVLGNSLGSISKMIQSDSQLGDTITEINKKLKDIIIKLLKDDKEYILLFDELDLGYDAGDNTYLTRIIGLLLAAYYFYTNSNFKNKNVKLYIFLRSDIFELIDFQDKNKIKDNLVEVLNWSPFNEQDNLSLKSLSAKRIEENLSHDDSSFDENWNLIFEDQNIGSNQKKWNYITDRTFLRPRDYIKFMNLSLDAAKKRIKNGENRKQLITNKDIHSIKREYSEYLYDELKDEVSAKYENFDIYLEVLRDIHATTFTIEEFNNSCNEVRKRHSIPETNSDILSRLYEFSIIGFYKPGGGGYGGSTYCYKYTDPNIKFNPKATKYKIHPGFKDYLELVG